MVILPDQHQLEIEPGVIGLDPRAQAVVGSTDVEEVAQTHADVRISAVMLADPGFGLAGRRCNAGVGVHLGNALFTKGNDRAGYLPAQ